MVQRYTAYFERKSPVYGIFNTKITGYLSDIIFDGIDKTCFNRVHNKFRDACNTKFPENILTMRNYSMETYKFSYSNLFGC